MTSRSRRTHQSAQVTIGVEFARKVLNNPVADLITTFGPAWDSEWRIDSSPHRYISGGIFALRRDETKSDWCGVSSPATYSHGNGSGFTGANCLCSPAQHTPVVPVIIPDSEMMAYGVQGWNQFKPTNRGGALAQALVESKDVSRMLHGSTKAGLLKEAAKGFHQLVGSSYLNYEFGWKMFLADVRDFIKNTLDTQKRLDQLVRDNDKWVQRHGTVAHTTSTTSGPTGFINPSIPFSWAGYHKTGGSQTVTVSKRFTFSAAFKYHLDSPGFQQNVGKFFGIDNAHRILYGLDISPSLLYQLVPWSWLVDWYSSVGNSIANLCEDQSDNLVAKYAYITRKKVTATTDRLEGYYQAATQIPCNVGQTVTTTEILRYPATPFGFFFLPHDLSIRQMAILGSLGLTHLIPPLR